MAYEREEALIAADIATAHIQANKGASYSLRSADDVSKFFITVYKNIVKK